MGLEKTTFSCSLKVYVKFVGRAISKGINLGA
jgi:hypothetical protein